MHRSSHVIVASGLSCTLETDFGKSFQGVSLGNISEY